MQTVIKQIALVYCRVSTEEQAREGYSLNAQEKFCRRFAEDNGYTILDVYRDEGKSATNLNRPALQELLTTCQRDKNVKAVIIQETDRLARNTYDHLTIRSILKKAEVKLISVAQPMLDESPEGNMIDTILASVNQFQSDLNSRKTKKGLQEKFELGWWPGWAPLGYISKRRGDKTIVAKDPERWDLVRQSLKMYISGNYSASRIVDILYDKGLRSKTGKKIPNSIMINTLKNPFYAGIMKWNNQERKGKHEPMIAFDEHRQIITIMENHNHHACRMRKHSFLLNGFAFCRICNQRYTAEKHPLGDYYHCSVSKIKHSNKGQNIQTQELEKQAEETFKDIQFSKDFIDLVVRKIKKFYKEKKKKKKRSMRVLLNKKMAIEKKREKAEEKLIKGTLEDEDFVRMRDRFRTELLEIQSQLYELDNQRNVDTDTIREVLMLARNIYGAYKNAPYEIKRQYLAFFWEGFWVKDKKIVKTEPTKLIKTLKNEGKIIIRDDWLRG